MQVICDFQHRQDVFLQRADNFCWKHATPKSELDREVGGNTSGQQKEVTEVTCIACAGTKQPSATFSNVYELVDAHYQSTLERRMEGMNSREILVCTPFGCSL